MRSVLSLSSATALYSGRYCYSSISAQSRYRNLRRSPIPDRPAIQLHVLFWLSLLDFVAFFAVFFLDFFLVVLVEERRSRLWSLEGGLLSVVQNGGTPLVAYSFPSST